MSRAKAKECRSPCPIANALDVVGDHWTLLIIRDLMFLGKHEYHEFLNGPEGISTNILAERLKRLVETGIIKMLPHPTNKTRKFYYLTPKGKDLMPLLVEMILWGVDHLPSTKVPRGVIHKIKKEPDTFMKETREKLKVWEKEFLE